MLFLSFTMLLMSMLLCTFDSDERRRCFGEPEGTGGLKSQDPTPGSLQWAWSQDAPIACEAEATSNRSPLLLLGMMAGLAASYERRDPWPSGHGLIAPRPQPWGEALRLPSGLDDAALRIADPEAYHAIKRHLGDVPALDTWLNRTAHNSQALVSRAGCEVVEVQRRVKSPCSIWEKMQVKGLELTDIKDVLGLRFIVPTAADAYATLEALQAHYGHHAPIKDYIAQPKRSGYQSLHSQLHIDGRWVELQIRTPAMHAQAEGEHDTYKARRMQQWIRDRVA